MWIAQKLKQKAPETEAAALCSVTIGGAEAAVMAESEIRGIKLCAPRGYAWMPKAGDTLLVMKSGGEACALGTPIVPDTTRLAPGEIYLASDGGAAIHLKNDGSVDLIGTILLNGVPLETGGD